MMQMDGSISALSRLKLAFNKWRLAFFAFAAVYAVFISLGLTTAVLQWDEAPHLNGGLFLLQGQLGTFMHFNAFYPPMFDVATAGFFNIFGISLLSSRLVALTFSVLTLWVVFEFANKMYGAKTALLSAVLLGVMPGFFWLSRMAMIETMLTFFFTLSLLLFFVWFRNRKNIFLVLSGLALGIGFLTKYQVVIAGAVMVFSLLFLARGQLKARFSRFPILILTFAAVAAVWVIIAYQTYASDMINQWIYALEVGNPGKVLYTDRFFTPIFYFVDMTWPYSHIHPISVLLYGVGLAGLGFFAWRRKLEDKFLLIWFVTVFVFFTLIPNKEWRYVVPLFPTLAISASCLIIYAFKISETLDNKIKRSLSDLNLALVINEKFRHKIRCFFAQRFWWLAKIKKRQSVKISATLFALFLVVGVALSVYDAYGIAEKDQFPIEIQQASNFLYQNLQPNESAAVVCANNFFSQDMIQFYLWMDGSKHNEVWQYPTQPVDSYMTNFNVDEFISLCKDHHTKYVFTYELGSTVPYFNSTLNMQTVATMIFSRPADFTWLQNDSFGINPRRIFTYEFTG
jgi:4-amino-4-deoxy-L-arabinose transferase-like glycosyltransferase